MFFFPFFAFFGWGILLISFNIISLVQAITEWLKLRHWTNYSLYLTLITINYLFSSTWSCDYLSRFFNIISLVQAFTEWLKLKHWTNYSLYITFITVNYLFCSTWSCESQDCTRHGFTYFRTLKLVLIGKNEWIHHEKYMLTCTSNMQLWRVRHMLNFIKK
jgi:hypothetical protein